MYQGITDFAETETLQNKVSVGANVSFQSVATMKLIGFVVFWVFAAGQHVDG